MIQIVLNRSKDQGYMHIGEHEKVNVKKV
jgi:hypothetical protein